MLPRLCKRLRPFTEWRSRILRAHGPPYVRTRHVIMVLRLSSGAARNGRCSQPPRPARAWPWLRATPQAWCTQAVLHAAPGAPHGDEKMLAELGPIHATV